RRSTMSKKANLSELLAETGGSARHRKNPIEQPSAPKAKTQTQAGRGGTSPITVHFPKQVRDQLKILAVQNGKTLHSLVAEAFNDLFAKHGKPEIAPAQTE
ncbi:MAG: ribbon-helix-helix domain-containing protein, partial [Terriglobales bacterium]